LGWVETESTWPLIGLFYQPRMIDDECGAVDGIRIGRGNRNTRRKPAPVPFGPPLVLWWYMVHISANTPTEVFYSFLHFYKELLKECPILGHALFGLFVTKNPSIRPMWSVVLTAPSNIKPEILVQMKWSSLTSVITKNLKRWSASNVNTQSSVVTLPPSYSSN
jgi:hypothetical protein